ncbi:hypothetical protein VB776_15815 [Arcicella sp. DC2W]|uniref:Uncharacterized protein n=1 Tax=Arcicella gelida TaxID=2984195 RepID=A0ABU5S7L1_9BACT|nr:hypothetical protein [Arcicella sp. DC2W]MEA5404400.1 hypothetical protein [Arcicella sp. DC2W]
MKKIIYYFIFLGIYSLFFTTKTFAQHTEPSPEQLTEFKELTLRRVNDLTNYIKQIGDKSLPERPRLKSIQLAMSLFDTVYYNSDGEKVIKMPTVQVSRKDGSVENIPIKQYFNTLFKLPHFPKVEISSYDVSYCSDFEKGMDGNYHATAFYYQRFKGYDQKGKVSYESKDRKAIEVTEKPNAKGKFTISFGNISVIETTALSPN